IVQGPLMRYGDVGLQLQKEHEFKFDNLKHGAELILWGLFKKMVIADRISAISGTVFSKSFVDYSGSEVFFGVLAYSFYIYCDFSGGIDITRGAAQMMDIELPMNFERPFFATSMADFWRRWHMSLGAWMREYVFYPVMLCKPVSNLSKKLRKKYGTYYGKLVPSVAAPMVVFFLIGIWHGLSWNYIINGLYNALLISGSVAMTPVFEKMTKALKVNTEAFSFRLFQMARTFLLLCISRIIVRAPTIPDALKMIKAMFTDIDFAFISGVNEKVFEFGVSEKDLTILFFSIMVLLVVAILQENGVKIRQSLDKQNLPFRWLMLILLIAAIVIFGTWGPGYDATSFIYGNF
ncbi:MAG: MBOAT family protein, partial [Clostridia bacterium]|nr:MBOAT family protein [Clostridia bacterium]